MINQNNKNQQEPPRDIIQSIMNTFSNGQKKEAIQELESLIKEYPSAPLLFNVIGSFYKSNSQLDIAITKFKRALALKPNYAEVHYNLGVTLREIGQTKEAIKSYKNALSIKNTNPHVHYNLGNALLSLKQYDDAITHLKLAVEFNPSFAQAYNNLGLVYKRIENDLEAGRNFDKALAINPDYAEAANDRGVIYQNDGDFENAIKYYEKALAINPNLADAYNNIGLCLNFRKDKTDNAIKSYEDALSIDPNLASAYYNLSRVKKYNLSKEQVAKMQSLLNTIDISQTNRITINFALAAAYENLENQTDFFKHLHEGNRLRKKELDYSFKKTQKLFSMIYKIFNDKSYSIKKTPKLNTPTKRPIFILGMPRSGTSLVEQIISSHKSVYGGGELPTLVKLCVPMYKKNLENEENINIISEKNLMLIRKKYLESLTNLNTSADIITDKTPANFQNIGFILSIFPEAKIIHLKRDPRAICWSIYKSNWSSKGYGFSYNMNDLVKFYGSYSELMTFWHKKFPGKIHDICYEDLTNNQEEDTKKLLKYCELDWDENCLNFHKNERAVKTASSLQVREKMYQGSSEAWKKYETHIQPLIDGLKPYLNQ
jgi:tetratricopeptide (TPR) repeat protein